MPKKTKKKLRIKVLSKGIKFRKTKSHLKAKKKTINKKISNKNNEYYLLVIDDNAVYTQESKLGYMLKFYHLIS